MDVMLDEIRDLRAERDGLREDIRQILDWHNYMGGPHKIREIAERALVGGDEIRDVRAERDRYKAALQKVVGGEVYRECPENYPGERFMWVRGIARRALAEGRDDGT